MQYFGFLLISFLGLAVGSFLGNFTYRTPRGESVKTGRSKCPKCKKKIAWFDNIPLFSYLALGGRCRHCKKKISPRYFFIELGTMAFFLLTYKVYLICGEGLMGSREVLCEHYSNVGVATLPYFLVVGFILMFVFIVDLEHQLIFDQLVFFLLLIAFVVLIFVMPENLYEGVFVGFASSVFFLLLHMITKGKGMGLGDVKLAIPLGMTLLRWELGVVWIFLSFLIGALVGLGLIAIKKAKFGKQIPFGPFMIFAFFVSLFWGQEIIGRFFPFL